MATKYVTFVLGEVEFGISIEYVNYIELPLQITKIPQSPKYIKGVSTIRGKIIPIFDLKNFLFQEETSFGKEEFCRIIGVTMNNQEVGILVDSAKEIIDISEEQIQQISSSVTATEEDLYTVAKIEDRLIMILAPEEIIRSSNILEVMKEVQHSETR